MNTICKYTHIRGCIQTSVFRDLETVTLWNVYTTYRMFTYSTSGNIHGFIQGVIPGAAVGKGGGHACRLCWELYPTNMLKTFRVLAGLDCLQISLLANCNPELYGEWASGKCHPCFS